MNARTHRAVARRHDTNYEDQLAWICAAARYLADMRRSLTAFLLLATLLLALHHAVPMLETSGDAMHDAAGGMAAMLVGGTCVAILLVVARAAVRRLASPIQRAVERRLAPNRSSVTARLWRPPDPIPRSLSALCVLRI